MAGFWRLIFLLMLLYTAAMVVFQLLRQLEQLERFRRWIWGSARGGVRFDAPAGAQDGETPDLSDQRDAFTGEPLDPRRGIYRCSQCQAMYHAETFRLLEREHGGRCVACRTRSVHPFTGRGR
jgi:DNA-directed RNA polymerase subunit RPC12/RpoP